MKNNSTKWNTSDYVRVILLFVGQAIFLNLLFLGALFLKMGSATKFIEFFKQEGNLKESLYIIIASCILSIVIFIYFHSENRNFIYKTSNVLMLFAIIAVSLIACYLLGLINIYLRPFALCALLCLLLIDKRSAIFMNFIFCLIMLLCDLIVLNSTEYSRQIYVSLVSNFIGGMFAVFFIQGDGSRVKVLSKGFLIALPVIVSVLCLEFSNDIKKMLVLCGYALLGGVLSDALMIIMLPFYEYVYGALTNFRLSELTDHKSRLVRLLIERAPGTFNHIMIVAMLAEACSNAIGENPLLARACAYYHDMGKIKKPEFFTENQSGINPHNELTPELSTDIIRAHAKDGADLIRKARLPQVLADSAEQHHGTMPISYFYAKALKLTDGDLSVENFSYYGPKPRTKINAIIMICDACEAKVRTVANRTHENVDKAVKDIIEERMDLDQFTECDITFRELDIIRNTITNNLAGVYHERVKYPKLKKRSK